MPEKKGYPGGRVQSSTVVVNPLPRKTTSAKRVGVRKVNLASNEKRVIRGSEPPSTYGPGGISA